MNHVRSGRNGSLASTGSTPRSYALPAFIMLVYAGNAKASRSAVEMISPLALASLHLLVACAVLLGQGAISVIVFVCGFLTRCARVGAMQGLGVVQTLTASIFFIITPTLFSAEPVVRL